MNTYDPQPWFARRPTSSAPSDRHIELEVTRLLANLLGVSAAEAKIASDQSRYLCRVAIAGYVVEFSPEDLRRNGLLEVRNMTAFLMDTVILPQVLPFGY